MHNFAVTLKVNLPFPSAISFYKQILYLCRLPVFSLCGHKGYEIIFRYVPFVFFINFFESSFEIERLFVLYRLSWDDFNEGWKI